MDIGADEFGPLHLAVNGSLSAGSTVAVVVSGTPGLACFLRLGAPGLQSVPGLGTVFLRLAGSSSFPWPTSPSSVPVVVPSGLGGLLHLQAVGLGGGALALTNFVPLSF